VTGTAANSLDFAAAVNPLGIAQPPFSIQAFTGYAPVTSTTIASATAQDVVKLTSNYSENVAGATVGALLLAGDNIT